VKDIENVAAISVSKLETSPTLIFVKSENIS